MKKKLLVLSASAILASNFIFDNNASAVVSKNDIKSDAWNVRGDIYPHFSLEKYLDNLEDLILKLSIDKFSGYDQPEYKEAYGRYQKRFLAELDAIVKFVIEDEREVKYIKRYDTDNQKEKIGLTHQRYQKIYDNLTKNKNEFEKEVKEIENNNKELKRFNDEEFYKAQDEIYDLEHKALMVAKTFTEEQEARIDLYSKLNMIMAYKRDENNYKVPTNIPTNKRMLSEMKEDIETIIDEFFKDIGSKRPTNIPVLTEENKNDSKVKDKLREDTEKAKNNESLVDPGVKERADRAEKRLAELTKKSTESRENAAKARAVAKILKAKKGQKEFSYKKLRQPSKNQLLIQYPEVAQPVTTYTESITQSPQPVLKQQIKEEKVDVLKSKRPETTLNGLNGESHFVTMDESSNASTQFGSNAHVFEYSFDSTPKTTNIAKQNVKQENYNSVNNLAGMSGESQHVDFTQDSNPSTTYGGYGNAFDFTEDTAPKQPETITESHEIVLDYQTHATMSGFKTGVSTEAYYSSNELTK